MIGAGGEVTQFRAPRQSLGDLDADIVGKLIAAAADVALIIDAEGVVRDVAARNEELSLAGARWLGRAWIDTVTIESRPKIEALLLHPDVTSRPRQVNHPVAGHDDIPILYSTVPVGESGRIVAVGRDLRAMAQMQQRLVDAQQSMEREYSKLRHAETRYRLLFQLASEAVLIVDGSTLKVTEANPSTTEFLHLPSDRILNRSFASLLEPKSAAAAQTLLSRVRSAGRADEIHVRSLDGEREFRLMASLFRQERASYFLVRLGPLNVGTGAIIVPKSKSRLLSVVENLPDAFVVVGTDRRIMTVNHAFLDLAQLPSEDFTFGEPLDRWLGRSEVDVNVLVASLREHGSLRNFNTVLRGEYGAREDVEVSAVSVATGDQPCYGLTIRAAGKRPAAPSERTGDAQRSVAQLTELVGRVSLKELVRESTDVIERLCIEAALELTADNRASAAELLGLSRQSLYAKLRRYGLGDLDGADDE